MGIEQSRTAEPCSRAGQLKYASPIVGAADWQVANPIWRRMAQLSQRMLTNLENKLLNFAHHYEFEESGLKKNDLEKLINEKRVMYDHNVDQKGYKWSGKSKLKKIDKNLVPGHIAQNVEKYKNWLD